MFIAMRSRSVAVVECLVAAAFRAFFAVYLLRLAFFDHAAARMRIAAARTRSGSAFEARIVFAADFLFMVFAADPFVGWTVEMVDARTVRHFPIPAVLSAFNHEIDGLSGPAR